MNKEKSIIMSGESVRAILEGRKTQTRRVEGSSCVYRKGDRLWVEGSSCVYRKGDRLWVREAWGERVKKDLSVRKHHCLKCGLRLHRDHNAAKNILNKAVGQTVESVKWNNSSCLLSESTIHTL